MREPVGSTGGGQFAPIMLPDERPPGPSHFCEVVGSTVEAPRESCPYCSTESEPGDSEHE